MTTSQHIQIFDTTLRDGQQCPGAGMSIDDNLTYAVLVSQLGIDVLEAGFPAASQTDFTIVSQIAAQSTTLPQAPIIASLCQLRENQIIRTLEALQPAKRARLHVYLPVDPNLMPASLGQAADNLPALVEEVFRLIKLASSQGVEVEFSPEGYSRMGNNFDFVTDCIRAAISAGATIINCPDTIGGACHLQGENYFVSHMTQHARLFAKEFPNKKIIWSAHCHNDFGLALENSINAAFTGPARQIEGCFNGIGERAGNVALEQVILYIEHFGQLANPAAPFYTQINLQHLQAVSDFINLKMLTRQPHWPITGGNAAKHTSGGHTNAILKNPQAYQPFDPKSVGKEISFLFGPLSGGNHAKSIIDAANFVCEDHEKAAIAQFIKDIYHDRRKGITDEELITAYRLYRKPIVIERFSYAKEKSHNRLELIGKFFGLINPILQSDSDDSALATLHEAISRYLPGISIENYHSAAATKGIDAKSQSTIVLSIPEGTIFTGIGIDKDIEISALKALVDAANQAYFVLHYTRRS